MTTARDDILSTLRARARRNQERPAIWQSNRQFDDLAEEFTSVLTVSKGEVFRASNRDAAFEKLGELLADLGVQRAVANHEVPLSDADLPTRFPTIEWHIAGQTEGDLRASCAAADVGISGADAALAETGSIVVSSGPGKSRMVSLLPPVHIALVSTSRLTPDIVTWAAAREGKLPANRVIISGPSKSGDIAQILVLGMHGPKRFIVILLDE